MTYSSGIITDAPLVFWELDETSGTVAADSSGNGRSGTYFAGVAHTGPSLVSGLAVSAHVTNDTITVADAAWMDQAAWSVEIWFASTDTVSARGLACRDDGSSKRHWDLHLNEAGTGKVDIRAWTVNTASQVVSTAATYNDGNPHHAVATYDGATLRLYVDGVQQGTGLAVTGLTSNVTSGINVASHTQTSGPNPGDVAAFAYYPAALSGARVATHFAVGAGGPSAALEQSSALTATGSHTALATAALTQASVLTATPSGTVTQNGTAALEQSSALTATAFLVVNVPLGPWVADLSRSAGFALDVQIGLTVAEADDPAEALAIPRDTESEVYADPVLVDGRPT